MGRAGPDPRRRTITNGTVTELWFYPIRGLSGQRLDAVTVSPERGFPLDRSWVLAKRSGEYATVRDRPLGTGQNHGLTAHPRLAGVRTDFDPETEWLEVRVQDHVVLACSLSEPEGVTRAEELFARVLDLEPEDRPFLARRADEGYNFNYTASVSGSLTWACHLVNLATVREVESRIDSEIDPRRFRPNLCVDLDEPWIELDLIGREFSVGEVRMRGEMPTARCAATEVNLETAERDLPLPRLLRRHYGHVDFGIYANILTTGELSPGLPVVVPEDARAGAAGEDQGARRVRAGGARASGDR